MKSHLFLFILFVAPFIGSQQSPDLDRSSENTDSLPSIENTAFKVGEYLKYRIHYGIINAGIAELSIKEVTERNNRPVYHMIGEGKTVGMAEWFFRTRDRYESFIDTEAIIPWEFIRDVDEGGFVIKRHLKFDQYTNQVTETLTKPEKTYSTIRYAQDMLSAFYYARCIKTDDLEVGEHLPVDMFLDYEDFSFRLQLVAIESIKTRWGKVRCKKLMPVVQEGRVFSDQEGLTLWVTDDENKVPVRLEAALLVGNIKMDLVDYKNLMHPIQFQK